MSMHLTTQPGTAMKPILGPLPLLIGFTGHRDLLPEDTGSLKRALMDIFSVWRERYPHTPLVLLTGLAEGADRLAAETALNAGMSHIAILPRPVDAYLDDFPTDSSREQFRRLLGQSVASVVVQSDSSVKGYAEQAERIGVWSHGLLAMWDGKEGEGASGTSDTVHLCLDGFTSPLCPSNRPLDPPETRPVWWLKVRRQRNSQAQSPTGIVRLFPGPENAHQRTRKAYDKLLADMETFNRTSVHDDVQLKEAEAKSLDYLLPGEVRSRLNGGLAEMLSRYARADVMAIGLQKRLKQCMDGMLAAVFFAGTFAQLRTWSEVGERVGPTIFAIIQWLPLVFFMIAAGCYLWEKLRKYHTRYLDYRALAEGLRVQIFWSIAGVRTNVADEYLTRYRGEIEWIRRAIRGTLLRTPTPSPGTPGEGRGEGSSQFVQSPPASRQNPHANPLPEYQERGQVAPDARAIVVKHWVEDQQRFFARNATKQARMPKVVGQAWKVALVIGFIIAVLKMLPPTSGPGSNRLLVIAGLSVFGLGLLKLRVKILALAEQARQYRRMADVFSRASEKLAAGADEQLILTELGREALAENADWLLLHRERPLELPKA